VKVELSNDEAVLLADYRHNTDRNKIVVRLLAKGLRASGNDALAVSDEEALRVLQELQQGYA